MDNQNGWRGLGWQVPLGGLLLVGIMVLLGQALQPNLAEVAWPVSVLVPALVCWGWAGRLCGAGGLLRAGDRDRRPPECAGGPLRRGSVADRGRCGAAGPSAAGSHTAMSRRSLPEQVYLVGPTTRNGKLIERPGEEAHPKAAQTA
jgi:hypothetical protein